MGFETISLPISTSQCTIKKTPLQVTACIFCVRNLRGSRIRDLWKHFFRCSPLAVLRLRSGDKSRRDSFIHSAASLLASDPAFFAIVFGLFMGGKKCVYGKDVHDIIKIMWLRPTNPVHKINIEASVALKRSINNFPVGHSRPLLDHLWMAATIFTVPMRSPLGLLLPQSEIHVKRFLRAFPRRINLLVGARRAERRKSTREKHG